MTRRTLPSLLLAIAACGSDPKPADRAPATPAAPPVATTPATSAAAGRRPASVPADLEQVYDAYVADFTALAYEIEAAGADCRRAMVVVEAHQASTQRLTPRLAATPLPALDPGGEITGWLATTYGPRIKAAAPKLGALETHCATDAALRAAMNALAGEYPFLRKRRG